MKNTIRYLSRRQQIKEGIAAFLKDDHKIWGRGKLQLLDPETCTEEEIGNIFLQKPGTWLAEFCFICQKFQCGKDVIKIEPRNLSLCPECAKNLQDCYSSGNVAADAGEAETL